MFPWLPSAPGFMAGVSWILDHLGRPHMLRFLEGFRPSTYGFLMMSAALKWLASLCVIAVLLWLGWHLWLKPRMMMDKGYLELTQAPIWADLQGIELQQRSAKNLQVPMLLKGVVDSGKYDVLGLAGTSQRNPYVWIVLNTDAGINGLYVMPANEPFSLPCRYLKTRNASGQINSNVRMALAAHCTRAEPVVTRATST